MPSPVDSNTPAQLSYLAARQRVEKVLAQFSVAPDGERSASESLAVSEQDLVKAVQQVNEVLRSYGVEFESSEDTGRIIIRLVDRESGEVIRQIPPEEALNAAQRLEEVRGRLLSLQV
ncbi:flagellar protein FlaG [Microbulbifer thermotolerans]|uniref:Flagellar protein FlaG n=1 Tax=Microbulbifer thermotolerans TaxID=252514 RepID=A0AB35HX59_MICTH|nr:flagellar protein FlaG [Microbulbifer thermotolerans]MCX2780126.1 flagellar protein FlaG [Microbulbifer thermotolerans]MCX2802153.1 flagellar protein FlaG [Microbulbifer thermotolerans]MCX2805550.1 flagellar protein FlaG [Microbulbifer thermotolerans]MCX2831922.1 flagellar protein FlaG [Microbulbifer thermotolerans]MCX2842513.1 flagellar protein FlaG [Microbulbifer thermotolerans]